MRRFALASACLLGLAGCKATAVTTALSSPAGQLFCAVQTAGGGAVVVGLVDAEASALSPAAGPIAVIATGTAKQTVDADCAKAGGVAVSPPAAPAAAPQLAIVPAAPPA